MTAQIDVNNKLLPNISKIETKKENWVMIIQVLFNFFFFFNAKFHWKGIVLLTQIGQSKFFFWFIQSLRESTLQRDRLIELVENKSTRFLMIHCSQKAGWIEERKLFYILRKTNFIAFLQI